jgi:phosphohistidine phosphatase
VSTATPPRLLWLLRHAEAQVEAAAGDPSGGDHARALTRRGVAEATRAAARCAELGWQPELLLASSATRTRQTAEIVARGLGLAAGKIVVLDELYLADPDDIRRAAAQAGPRITRLMIVAHNPGISAFARQLAPDAALPGFDTAGMARFELHLEDWSQLAPGAARAAQYDKAR